MHDLQIRKIGCIDETAARSRWTGVVRPESELNIYVVTAVRLGLSSWRCFLKQVQSIFVPRSSAFGLCREASL